ncbi:unnamed protein product [Candidula unifasciata]|uniref:Vitellinogen open beta-sheet domain-containing protein n=1 Tax=Candidula unifasciata TaxID=100452 RepID=A0A8S4A9P2_9EUPU|nr:unnamed protein product [Candidula unifasciata]
MRCPDEDTLSQISQLLSKETDDHVGGFIYSHLTNLKETSDPLKQDIARAISLHSFKEFTQNVLKYSSNHEASVLINKLNLGFTADSNIIMSPNSPLPRSAMLNLTVDLFGNSINLLEIGGRVEGLEVLIERLLGPNGYFSVKSAKWDDDKLKDVKTSIYTRVFGNEIFYGHIKGTQDLPGPGKIPNLLDILKSLANRQTVAYTYSQQLMDVSLIVPTIAGLPLEITVNGSMNLDLKAEGKADLRSVATSPRSMEIDGEFRPSAALEVTGTMAVNALTTRMGLRMRNTMHSSTWLKGHIEINRGRVLNVEIEPPGDKMEIFNAKSQFFIIHNDIEKEQEMVKENYQEHKLCSGDKVATIIGVELCGELKFPNASSYPNAPYFPLTGPVSFSVMTYRRDTHTSYKLLAKRKESKESSTAQFMMDTPNSQVNRMISTDITIVYTPDKQVDVLIASPWKKLSMNSALVSNKDILSFVGSILLDDSDKYGLTTELKISKTGNAVAYTPFIELTQSGHTNTLLSGLVNVDMPGKFDANLEVKGFGMSPYTVEGGLVNQENEKRARLSLSNQGKTMYVFNVGSTIDRSGKDNRNIKVEPQLIVKTQDQTLLSITGSSDYKADRSATGDITVDIYKMKPASVSWKVNQNNKGKQSNYNVDLRVKSVLLTGSIEGDLNHQKNFFTSKLKIGYNVPKLGTDVVTWHTKFNNKSKNTFSKYLLTSNLDMKKYTDYNAGLTVGLGYKKKQTDVDVELKYGANPKDKKKVVILKSSLNKDISSWKNADVGFQLRTQAPERNIDLNMKVSHSHTPNKLDSNVNLKFVPYLANTVDAKVSLQDKSNKLMSYVGQANLGIMGKKFALSTDLTQKSPRHFQHVIDVQDFNGGSHSASTVYKVPSSNGHEVTSDIKVSGYKPIQLQGKTTFDPLNFQASGSAACGKDVYNVSTQTKLTDAVKKINLELLYPNRQIVAEAEIKNIKDKVTGSVMVDLDASRNGKSKVSVEGSYRNTASWDSKVVSGSVNVKTPFARLEDLSADASYNSDSSQFSSKGKVSWGGKENTVSSSVVVKRPLSWQNAEITLSVTSPFKQYKEMELEINHKIQPVFASSVKGKVDSNEAQLVVKGENRGSGYNRDFYGFVEMKTPFNALRDIGLSLEHKDNGRAFKTVGSLGHNSKKFGADLQVDHNSNWDSTVNTGNLLLTWPGDQLHTTWQHNLVGTTQIKSSLESTWSGSKRVFVNLAGSNNVENNVRHVLATVNAETPWRSNKNIFAKFDTKMGSGRYESSVSVLNNRLETIAYNVLLESKPSSGSALFMLRTPLYDQKIHGQTEVNWNTYPATASAWLEWAPWARIDFEGSLNAPSVDDLELNTRLVTPFKNFENIIARASHKLEAAEYVSTATVNYGVRKTMDFENRFQYDDDIKLFRTKLTSPCPYLKSLNTGLKLSTLSNKFEGSVDFELQPFVMKYDGFTTWNYDVDNWNAKLRLNTPLKQMPYYQVIAWSKKSPDSLRVSHIDIQPSYYGMYSMDNSYRLSSLPYQLDITLKTPHQGYETVGLSSLYDPTETSLQSRLRVNYKSNKEVDSHLKLDWKDNYEGSLFVNTPFSGYENNKILARHDITSRGFTCHGKQVLGERIPRVTYVILLTPVSGYETLSGNFSLRGPLNKLRGDASLGFGTNTLSTTFTNTLSLGLLKSSIAIYTPYTQDLKLAVQHKDSSSPRETKLDCSFTGQYGDQSVDGRLGLAYEGLQKSKVDLALKHTNQLSVSGKASVQTDISSMGKIEVSFEKSGPYENMVATAALARNQEDLAYTQVETSTPGGNLYGKVVTKGRWMPQLTTEVEHKGSYSDFNTKVKLNGKDTDLDSELVFKNEDSEINVNGNVNYKFDSEKHTHSFSIHKEGTWNDFKIDLTQKLDGDETTAVVQFEAENQIKGLAEVNNLFGMYDKLGVEFEHSGDLEKFITTGKVTLGSTQAVSGKVNFYRYNFQRIEASAELSTPWQDYRFSRISCSLNVQYGDGKKFSSDLVQQCSPSAHSLSLNIKTPLQGYEEIILSGDVDDSKANAKAILGDDLEFTVTGVHDISTAPYLVRYEISTPLDVLKKFSIALKGQPLDGSIDVSLLSLQKKIEGNGALQFTGPYKLSLSTEVSSDIEGWQLLQVRVQNDDDALKGKTTHLLVSWDPTQQVVVDGRYFSGSSPWAAKKEHVLELDVKVPFGQYRSISVDLGCNTEPSNVQSMISLEVNQDKLIDLDVTYDKSSKYEYSAIIRKPWPMEYTYSYQYDDYMKEGDVFVSWDRNDPASNIRIKSTMQYQPSNNDRSLTFTFFGPTRTVGVEHSLSSSTDKLTSSGKLFWDQDDKSKVSYSLDINTNNRRRDLSYSGDFKLGLPSRTFGLSGSVSNNDLARTADAAFSWDLSNDDSKRVEVQVSVSGQEYTKADITFKLPSQDLQVNSALILNQGNTIIDGKTDISYSSESRKTLTLFSKLRNTPAKAYSFFSGSGNSFNYSMELGLSHPETKVDVKIDSHLASSDEFLTSSVGIRYLTVSRQMKNLALFTEIDKIRKQISFVASGPSQNAGVRATILSEEPLSLVLLGSVNGQDKFKSTLDVDPDSKMFKVEIGRLDNLLSLKSYYPNSSAIQVELLHKRDYTDNQEAVIGLRLLNPRLLHSRITWRPEAVEELKNSVAQQISEAGLLAKNTLSQMNTDLRTELSGKYEVVTASVGGDVKPLLEYVGDELESFATDLENVKNKVNVMYSNNEFFIKDISNAAYNNIEYVSQSYGLVQDKLQNLIALYRDSYSRIIEELLQSLDRLQEFSISDSYNQVVTDGLQRVMEMLDARVTYLIQRLRETDLKVLESAQALLSNVGDLYNHPRLESIRERINTLRNIDYVHYAQQIHNAVRDNIDLNQYSDVLNYVKEAAVNRLIPESMRDVAERATNEIYQQSQLAYKHWNVEELLNKHLETSVQLLKDIMEDELREYLNLVLMRTPVTVFDPVHGRIEANFILPVDIKRLDEMPDLTPFIQQVSEAYRKYAPDTDTISQYYPSFLLSNKTEETVGEADNDADDELLANLDDYRPSRNINIPNVSPN